MTIQSIKISRPMKLQIAADEAAATRRRGMCRAAAAAENAVFAAARVADATKDRETAAAREKVLAMGIW